jgi:hypothetical protein
VGQEYDEPAEGVTAQMGRKRTGLSDQAFAECFCDRFRLGVHLKLVIYAAQVKPDSVYGYAERVSSALIMMAFHQQL